ncbi:hypothetical protein B9Q01_10790 [Candidatus Marsarchaeota G1 archaeon OSP_D]|jgi:Glycosyltransferase|uniref:Glycosyl transferase family 1 domain-containing protein n=1 Tax=Candidatus Marsarchaeota G1 archaeon OSP_D TaxID=1978155 RepID=A0A2R6A5N7_9ARCH|nr:MAG: hypothetical protein B9Q01_10790 [Candidatus Marsarchaeota G1 archaeon OSP_D]
MMKILLLLPSMKINDGVNRYSKDLLNSLLYNNAHKVGFIEIYNLIDLSILEPTTANNTFRGLIYGTPLSLIPNLRLRHLIKQSNYEIVHLTAPYLGHFLNYLENDTIKIITWYDFLEFSKERNGLRRIFTRISYFNALTHCDGIICISSTVKRQLEEFFKRNPSIRRPQKIEMINPGINQKFVDYKVNINQDRRDFVFIGRIGYLAQYKRFPLVLKNFSLVKRLSERSDLKLYVFSPSKNSLSLIVNELNSLGLKLGKDVIIHFNATDETIINVLSKAYALLHFSKAEGFGLPILESLSLGTPVITLKDADIPEEVVKYTYQETYESSIDRMLELIRNPKGLPKYIVEYAKSFNWKRKSEEVIKFYDDLFTSSR